MAKKPLHYDELYPGRFLKAGELQGKKVTLTIESIEMEELEGEGGKKMKPIFAFRETNRQIPWCKTNGICMKEMFGPEVQAHWVGKRVTFFPTEWNGEPAIRIWGSPDIDRDMNVTVALPRRKPFQMTMHKVESKAGAGAAA